MKSRKEKGREISLPLRPGMDGMQAMSGTIASVRPGMDGMQAMSGTIASVRPGMDGMQAMSGTIASTCLTGS